VFEGALCVGRCPLCWKVPFMFEDALCVGRCPLCLKVPFVLEGALRVGRCPLCLKVPFALDGALSKPGWAPQLLWPSFFVVVLSHIKVMPRLFLLRLCVFMIHLRVIRAS